MRSRGRGAWGWEARIAQAGEVDGVDQEVGHGAAGVGDAGGAVDVALFAEGGWI